MADAQSARRLVALTGAGVLLVGLVAILANGVNDNSDSTPSVPVATDAPVDQSVDQSVEPTNDPDGSTTDPSSPGDDPATGLPGARPTPPARPRPPTAQIAAAPVRLERVLEIPLLTAIEWSLDERAYYAITQDGYVHRIPENLSSSEVVMDLTDTVTTYQNLSERGLLGIAFDPVDGRMFLYFTDKQGHSNLVSYEMVDGRPDPDSRRLVLFFEQPGPGHQGGGLQFDHNGHLFLSIGDGGGSRGRDAQDYTKLFGSIIRIIPNRQGEGYTVPTDNPFVNNPDRRDELIAKGLRNPWGFAIDPVTGDIWIGDVGEDTREELNFLPADNLGLNFGWYWFEGTLDRGIETPPAGLTLTPPIHDYGRDQGVSIIVGVVYHGEAIPALQGALIYADMSGPLSGFGAEGATRLTARGGGVITNFAETPEREILITTLNQGLQRLLPG